jgi:hypothetical protein
MRSRQWTRHGYPRIASNEVYEARFLDACVSIKAQGVEHIIILSFIAFD